MIKIGTNYGGWYIPYDISLNSNSIIYSAGVGEDISFDIKLHDKYNCNIILIDPTQRAIKHFNEIKTFYNEKNHIFTGNIQNDYINCINNCNPDFSKFKYINVGLWKCKDILKFYKQSNENYVSQSLITNMFTDKYEEVHVNSIKNIMEEHNHRHIDLLKIDIEGAEIEVLEQMLLDNIKPTYLLVEFDLYLKRKDLDNKTQNIINKLLEYYYILINDSMNITFKLKN